VRGLGAGSKGPSEERGGKNGVGRGQNAAGGRGLRRKAGEAALRPPGAGGRREEVLQRGQRSLG